MKFECLTPSQCGIGNDCSNCHEKHVEKLDATIDKLVEALEDMLEYEKPCSDTQNRYRRLINSVTEKK